MNAGKTVGVGVGILVVRDGRVLLGKRRSSHGAGAWSAPGGKLEYGETFEACARRELSEETGLVLGSIELGPYTNDLFPEVEQQYLTVFVLAREVTGEPENKEPHKCEGWAWFKWTELPTPLFAPLESLRKTGFVIEGTR
jgi:8-oxo-dGTP diphosphatase